MRQSKRLAILAALTMGVQFSSHALASDTDYAYYNGKKFIEFEYFNEGEFASEYTMSDFLKNAAKSSTSYWSEMLGPRSKSSSAWQIFVYNSKNYPNAGAGTFSYTGHNETLNNYVAQMMQEGKLLDYYNLKNLAGINPGGTTEEEKFVRIKQAFASNLPAAGDTGVSMIQIGQYLGANRNGAVDGWWVDTDTVLPTNEQACDYVGTIRHELMHALGAGAHLRFCDWNGNEIEDGDEEHIISYGTDKFPLLKFANNITDTKQWNFHLQDQNGNFAKPGMLIVTNEGFRQIKETKPEAKESDYFIVDAGNYAYFIGENVTEALAGAKFNGISGVPVNAFEGKTGVYDPRFEGSHFQTSGMQSHRSYSNYTSFMEVELAALQDLGYDFDRKAYFGRSVYGNGQTINNTQGYFARNAAGTAYLENVYSQVPLGIGLHVYGANNHITQSANILTQGTGAVGIRVDGEKNSIIIPDKTEIHADGERGKGILVAYGRKQNLNVAGNVTASGKGGNAIEFNFGSSTNGAIDEYRGSYIRYVRDVSEENGAITVADNQPLNDMDSNTYNASADELMGEQVTDFNLRGKIAGGENAIYIGRNAFVKNINVENGASIQGNITSDWKHFSEEYGIFDTVSGKIKPLYIQYNGGKYVYNRYIPDLVTNLNFNLQDGAMLYQGNISGSDNMKLNVKSGDLVYTGTADVVNVNVSKGAGLYGGTYTVNDMTSRMAEGFSDDTTGKFLNQGTIGAASKDSTMTINGNLVSDGVLSAYGGGFHGNISVSGTADIEGSVATATNALPDETLTVLEAGTVSGTLANPDGKPYAATGMLNTTGVIEGQAVKVKTSSANNLGAMTAEQADAYDAVETMQKGLAGDARRNELRPLYSLNPSAAKHALTGVGSSAAPQAASLVQQSTVASRVISDRLSAAFAARPVEVTVPASCFAESAETNGLKVKMDLPVAQDNNAWVKFTKNWGDLRGGASYHGSAISGGYDRRLDDHWRGGVFLSYQTMGLGAQYGGSNIYDTRFGLYAGYHKKAADAYLYADYGWVRNKLRRGIGALGLGAEARYNSNLFEIGGEYKYDLHAKDGKLWHVSPYAGLQLSWLNQKSYAENGAGIFNQHVAGKHSTYFAGQLGVELKRYLPRGSYGLRLGVKHAFAGADPELSFHYEGNDGKAYTLRNNQDKTHFILSLSGETEFAKGWFLNGEAQLQKGAHDKDISASLQFKRVW